MYLFGYVFKVHYTLREWVAFFWQAASKINFTKGFFPTQWPNSNIKVAIFMIFAIAKYA